MKSRFLIIIQISKHVYQITNDGLALLSENFEELMKK